MSSDQDLLEWCRAQRRRAHQQEQADEQASAASNGISDIGEPATLSAESVRGRPLGAKPPPRARRDEAGRVTDGLA